MVKKTLAALAATFIVVCCVFCFHACSEINTTSWERLSDKDIGPQGRAALIINKKNWKHAETEHFVCHFTDDKEAEICYVNSEVYYNWIKDFFGVLQDKWRKKNHVFIFTEKPMWDDFLARLNYKRKVDGFTNGWELFMYRQPDFVGPRESLAHEMTHIIVFRFTAGPLPLFLNEGFAEFVSSQAIKLQLEEGGWKQGLSKHLNPEEYIPLNEIAAMNSYPEGRVAAFYGESGWFTKFLVSKYGKEKFYDLLKSVSHGEDFKRSLEKVCGSDLETVENDFKSYCMAKN